MFDEDLAAFFDDREHAREATYNSVSTVLVILDNEYRLAHEMVSTTDPVVMAKASDFPVSGAPVGKTLVISGTTYTIRDRQPIDDGALVRLQLEAA